MKYSVIEIQVDSTGAAAFPPIATYDNRNEAESKYHTVLSVAAVSSLARHTAMLITEDGQLIARQSYNHGNLEEDE